MVTDLIRDIGDPQAGVPQIGLGEFDPPAVDILRKAVAGDLPGNTRGAIRRTTGTRWASRLNKLYTVPDGNATRMTLHNVRCGLVIFQHLYNWNVT